MHKIIILFILTISCLILSGCTPKEASETNTPPTVIASTAKIDNTTATEVTSPSIETYVESTPTNTQTPTEASIESIPNDTVPPTSQATEPVAQDTTPTTESPFNAGEF